QQTLRGAIDWSYELLDADEKRLFARLGVFVGGCTLEATEAVCNAENDLPVDVLDGLSALVNKSLLLQIEGVGGEPVFMIGEAIHGYALERLGASGEMVAIRRQHGHYFLTLAELAEPELHGPQQQAWLERLEIEHDNIRAALGWAVEAGNAAMA